MRTGGVDRWFAIGLDATNRRERQVDLGLTVLLLLQGFTLFVAIPSSVGLPYGHLLLDACHVSFALVCIGVLSRHRGVHLLLLAMLALLVAGPAMGPVLGADLALAPDVQHQIVAVAAFCFNGAVTALVARHVFMRGGRVTVHRVRGAMLLYLNVASLFAIAYGWIDMTVPDAFAAAGRSVPHHVRGGIELFSYFSLSTITTTGFGDVVPVHPLARSLANLEAVFGQLFPATLLARLVSLHLLGGTQVGPQSRAARSVPRDPACTGVQGLPSAGSTRRSASTEREVLDVDRPSRRDVLGTGSVLAGALAIDGAASARAAQDRGGFMAASGVGPGRGPRRSVGPGIQGVTALCEVTGGGEKVYGIAVEYDAAIDPTSPTVDTYRAGVVPAAPGFFPGMPREPDKNAAAQAPAPRAVAAVYVSSAPALRDDRRGAVGRYVIVEFAHDPDLSVPTTDSDEVSLVQAGPVRSVAGAVYPASARSWSNVDGRGRVVVIRGVDAWEQNHWWWDDARSTWLEYSIYLPKSFLAPGGERKDYPLVLAVTHSGTSYDGTCAQTLTEQCIASIWSLPEEQALRECVVVTPRYERTTMNDYWEHTNDVENTHRLVQSLISGTWNHGNPNLPDRAGKTLRIDPRRVYATGWSMGAMTTLWLMAKHPETFAGGLVIAGQQRPEDMVPLARQNVLIITGSEDDKATPWNERCVPLWRKAGGKVTRPAELLDPALIFPVDRQERLTAQVDGYLARGGDITFLTFEGVDHMASCRKFFYIKAARAWLFRQVRG